MMINRKSFERYARKTLRNNRRGWAKTINHTCYCIGCGKIRGSVRSIQRHILDCWQSIGTQIKRIEIKPH